jgi:hypothetical protein
MCAQCALKTPLRTGPEYQYTGFGIAGFVTFCSILSLLEPASLKQHACSFDTHSVGS